jgi:hypothetical protein
VVAQLNEIKVKPVNHMGLTLIDLSPSVIGHVRYNPGLVWVWIRSYLGFVCASFRVFRVYWSPLTVVNMIKVELHQITLHRW